MKFCSFYYRKFEGHSEINEFKIIYKQNHEKLFYFISQCAEVGRRVNIRLTETDIQDIVLSGEINEFINLENKNFSFILPSIVEYNKQTILLFIDKLKENEISFFFEDKVYSIDKVWELIDLGVSDVYICGELGFELQQISQKIHEAGVNIRVFPDVAQSSGVVKNKIKQFFIRPEDVAAYEDYVDVCEFYEEEKEGRIELLYLAYCQKKEWTTSLSDIIEGLDILIPGAGITKHFGQFRTKCGKKCMKTGKCNMCETAVELATALLNAELRLVDIEDKE